VFGCFFHVLFQKKSIEIMVILVVSQDLNFHGSNFLNGLLIGNGLVAFLGHRIFQNGY
jgi:hypothetical protein